MQLPVAAQKPGIRTRTEHIHISVDRKIRTGNRIAHRKPARCPFLLFERLQHFVQFFRIFGNGKFKFVQPILTDIHHGNAAAIVGILRHGINSAVGVGKPFDNLGIAIQKRLYVVGSIFVCRGKIFQHTRLFQRGIIACRDLKNIGQFVRQHGKTQFFAVLRRRNFPQIGKLQIQPFFHQLDELLVIGSYTLRHAAVVVCLILHYARNLDRSFVLSERIAGGIVIIRPRVPAVSAAGAKADRA